MRDDVVTHDLPSADAEQLLYRTALLRVENFAAAALVILYGFGFFSLRMTGGRPTNVSLPLAIAMAALAFAPSFGRRHIAAARGRSPGFAPVRDDALGEKCGVLGDH